MSLFGASREGSHRYGGVFLELQRHIARKGRKFIRKSSNVINEWISVAAMWVTIHLSDYDR